MGMIRETLGVSAIVVSELRLLQFEYLNCDCFESVLGFWKIKWPLVSDFDLILNKGQNVLNLAKQDNDLCY